jgi:hypothetical protein
VNRRFSRAVAPGSNISIVELQAPQFNSAIANNDAG